MLRSMQSSFSNSLESIKKLTLAICKTQATPPPLFSEMKVPWSDLSTKKPKQISLKSPVELKMAAGQQKPHATESKHESPATSIYWKRLVAGRGCVWHSRTPLSPVSWMEQKLGFSDSLCQASTWTVCMQFTSNHAMALDSHYLNTAAAPRVPWIWPRWIIQPWTGQRSTTRHSYQRDLTLPAQ